MLRSGSFSDFKSFSFFVMPPKLTLHSDVVLYITRYICGLKNQKKNCNRIFYTLYSEAPLFSMANPLWLDGGSRWAGLSLWLRVITVKEILRAILVYFDAFTVLNKKRQGQLS